MAFQLFSWKSSSRLEITTKRGALDSVSGQDCALMSVSSSATNPSNEWSCAIQQVDIRQCTVLCGVNETFFQVQASIRPWTPNLQQRTSHALAPAVIRERLIITAIKTSAWDHAVTGKLLLVLHQWGVTGFVHTSTCLHSNTALYQTTFTHVPQPEWSKTPQQVYEWALMAFSIGQYCNLVLHRSQKQLFNFRTFYQGDIFVATAKYPPYFVVNNLIDNVPKV